MKSRVRAGAICVALLLALLALVPASAPAKGMSLGVADPLLQHADPGTQTTWWNRAAAAGANTGKLHLSWSSVAPSKPEHPRDPSDPDYRFGVNDQAVRNASARHMEVIIDVSSAPAWAEGKARPAKANPGTWKPSPSALGDFMYALAKRYSGGFEVGGQPLPRVRYFQVWNEPNIPAYLAPQWNGKKPASAPLYLRMLNASYEAVHQANKGARVVTAGTSPYGDNPGGKRMRPLYFWRQVLCLHKKGKGELGKAKCTKAAHRAHFDVFAHNPINTSGPPTEPARNSDDITTADMRRLTKTLRAAEHFGTVLPRGKRPVWAGELWYASKPPEPTGYPLAVQARYIQQSLFLMWKADVAKAIVYTLRDREGQPPYPWDSDGLYFIDDKPKPALTAFRFPFVASNAGRGEMLLWGMAPTAGTVHVQYRNGGPWRPFTSAKAGNSRVFTAKVTNRAVGQIRAIGPGGGKSLPWHLGA